MDAGDDTPTSEALVDDEQDRLLHELRAMLTLILGNAQMFERRVRADGTVPAREALERLRAIRVAAAAMTAGLAHLEVRRREPGR